MDNMNKSPIERAIDAAGGQTKLADHCQVSPQAVQQWIINGVPANRASCVEKATDGAVTRSELRPDLFGDAA